MKARIPKEYQDLSPSQKERLKDYLAEVAAAAAMELDEKNCRIILEIYMKMICCVLHDAFGFGEKRLTCLMYNHKRLFAKQSKLVSKGEQLEYLNKRMSGIFRKDGFPQNFVNDLLGEVEILEVQKKEN